MKRIGILLGTRPEAIKLLPVYLEMKKHDRLKPVLISTGQHKEMLQQIFDVFDVQADVDFDLMRSNQTLAGLTARLCVSLQDFLDKQALDLIIVQGDTTSAFIGGLIAFYNKIKVAHVEAGLRTYDKYSPFPEEINRQLIGCVADYHFAPTHKARIVLEKERKENIYMVGNTVIDSLLYCKEMVHQKNEDYLEKYKFLKTTQKVVLITGHRRESFGGGFENICDSIVYLAKKYPELLFVYPVHLNPNVRTIVFERLEGVKNIMMIDPVPYDEMIFLMNRAHILLTDSGGIQEEAPSLNVPALVMRETTERMEGVEAGCARLVGTDKDRIISNFIELYENPEVYQKMAEVKNPYGDGSTSKQIIEVLDKVL